MSADRQASTAGNIEQFDAFASYAVDPDSDLVRRVKALLEGFHLRPGVQERYREATGQNFDPIRICVDGKDFVFPKTEPDEDAPIDALVKSYLLRSRSLLVFSGTETISHPWINKEIDWFRVLCPGGDIHFALTHARDPGVRARFVPPALIDVEIGLFSDLRGHYQRAFGGISAMFRRVRSDRMARVLKSLRNWRSVRDFDEELARLAARLLSNRGHGDFAVEDLERGFENALRQSRRRRRVGLGFVGVMVLVLLGAFYNTATTLVDEQRLRTNRIWTSRADLLRGELDASLVESLALSASAIANGDREDGPRGMVQTLQRLVQSERIYQREGDPGIFQAGKRRAHIETLAEIPDSDEVLLGGVDGYLVLYDTKAQAELAEVYLDQTRILDIAVLPGAKEIAVGTRTGLFFVRLLRDDEIPKFEVIARSASDEDMFGVAYDPVWDRIVGGRLDAQVVVFKRPVSGMPWTGKTIYTIFDPDFAEPGQVSDIPASISDFELRHLPDGSLRAFMVSFSHFAVAVDLGENDAKEVWPAFFDGNTALTSVDVDAEGQVVLVTDLDGRIFRIDGITGALKSEIRTHQVESGSLAANDAGEFRFARPDVLGNVALELHPSGLFFGVSSHDRTTRFYDTGALSAGGFSTAVHNKMAREIRFSEDGSTAYSMSDDGALQRVRPFETYEVLRIAEIEHGYPIEAGSTRNLLLRREERAPILWSAKEGFRSISGLPEAPARWSMLQGSPDLLVYFGDEPRLFTVGADGVMPACGGKALDDVLGLDDREFIRDAFLLGLDGLVLFVPVDPDQASIRLIVIDSATCAITPMSVDTFPEDAKLTAAEGLVAVQAEPGTVKVWQHTELGFKENGAITSEGEIAHLAFAPFGTRFVAVEKFGTSGKGTFCLCNQARSFPISLVQTSSTCGIARAGMICTAANLPQDWHPSEVRGNRASPLGQYFIVQGADAEMGLLSVPATPWSTPVVHNVAPEQTRPIQAPFAFSANEAALAVPNGDTGVRILDPSDTSVLSVLPTPGRVYSLAFDEDYLISRDGANEDAILRVQPWKPEGILARACAFWPEGSVVAGTAGVPEIAPRSAFCAADP